MEQLADRYSAILKLKGKKEGNESNYYQIVAENLLQVTVHYNPKAEGILLGYVELANQFVQLSELYSKSSSSDNESEQLKSVIRQKGGELLLDLEDRFDMYPDETLQQDIAMAKELLDGL